MAAFCRVVAFRCLLLRLGTEEGWYAAAADPVQQHVYKVGVRQREPHTSFSEVLSAQHPLDCATFTPPLCRGACLMTLMSIQGDLVSVALTCSVYGGAAHGAAGMVQGSV